MASIHGHEVLAMMTGKSYSQDSLIQAIHQRFGAQAEFHTCSQSGLNAEQLVAFLTQKGKFKAASTQQFTVDSGKICQH